MADDLRALLNYIVVHYVVPDEQRAIELDAAPSDGGAMIEDDKRGASRREAERADEFATPFADGLVIAHHRATSRTEETDAQRYTYHVAVRWDRLEAVSTEAGIDLARALARHHPASE